MTPPDALAPTMRDLYGAEGEVWLAGLPARLEQTANRWALRLQPPFPNLSYNYVAPAVTATGAPVVVKVGMPVPELLSEIAALRWYDGRGAVRLLDAWPEAGALLLEALQPGHSLVSLAAEDDDRATLIAADVMEQLWRPVEASPPARLPSSNRGPHADRVVTVGSPPCEKPGLVPIPSVVSSLMPTGGRRSSFPTLGQWADGLRRLREAFEGATGPLPPQLVARAEALLAERLASAAPSVVLHGDLHHDNILAAGRAPWLAIDPKGLIGEPAYEVSAFVCNPYPLITSRPDLPRLLARRVAVLSQRLGLERDRLLSWAMIHAVLSAAWEVEDRGYGWEPWVHLGATLQRLTGG